MPGTPLEVTFLRKPDGSQLLANDLGDAIARPSFYAAKRSSRKVTGSRVLASGHADGSKPAGPNAALH